MWWKPSVSHSVFIVSNKPHFSKLLFEYVVCTNLTLIRVYIVNNKNVVLVVLVVVSMSMGTDFVLQNLPNYVSIIYIYVNIIFEVKCHAPW